MVEIKIRNGKGCYIDVDVKGDDFSILGYTTELEKIVYDVLTEFEKSLNYAELHNDFIELLCERFNSHTDEL